MNSIAYPPIVRNSGRSPLGWLTSIACLVSLAGCHGPEAPVPPPVPGPPPPQHLRIPTKGAYTGAFIDFGDTEDHVTEDGIRSFERLVGKHQAIVASSSYWGEQTFPRHNLDLIREYGAIPLIYWSPWDRPYEQDKPPTRFSLQRILDGQCDGYIDHWADEARRFGQPFFVSWGLEMNGTWFPWSGYFYNGPGGSGPELYKRCYRYVVDRVRARGAGNILWVFHVNNYSYPQELWNQMDRYFPGRDYVDWLGMSVYGKQFTSGAWINFPDAMDYAYRDLCGLDPTLPVMLAEWGIGEYPFSGRKAEWIQDGFSRLSTSYPRLKAIIFWHERWQNPDSTYSNLRVNSSPASLRAYREGVANDFWIGYPEYK